MRGIFFYLQREMAMKKLFAILAAFLFLGVMTSCGSGGGGSDTSDSTSPGENLPATAIKVSMSSNPSTATSSITATINVTDIDGGTAIAWTWNDNDVLIASGSATVTEANGTVTSTLTEPFTYNHTIKFTATADGVVSDYVSVIVTEPGNTKYIISGTVSGAVVSGVTITLIGEIGSAYVTSGSSGNYGFTDITNGDTCTITPSKAGYTFSPVSRIVTVNSANVTDQNFTAIVSDGTNLDGKYSGPGSDSSGPAQMTLQLAQHDTTITGTATAEYGGCIGSGIFSGTLSGTTLNFTINIPVGGVPCYPTCSVTMSGTANVTTSTIIGTYTGNNSCYGPFTNGHFTLTKQ
jgi:hypothetical protein